MVNLAKIEQLAKLKFEMKQADKEVKKLQKELLDDPSTPEKIQTSYGNLTLSSRTTYNGVDSGKYIGTFGQAMFNKAASISASGVKKAFGEAGLQDLDAEGLLTVKSVSQYFTLK